MEYILQTLSEYQQEAYRRGISCGVDMYFESSSTASVDVKFNYTVTGDVSKTYVFSTTLSTALSDSKNNNRLNEIRNYLNSIH